MIEGLEDSCELLSCTFEMEDYSINKTLFEKLCGSYTQGSTFKLVIPYTVQRRKHRKKRINKKWAKRYGFKTYYKEFDTKIDSVSKNGEWSFTVDSVSNAKNK